MPLYQQYPNLALVTGAVVIILALASGGYGWLLWQRPTPNLPKIGYRLRFSWLLTASFILVITFGPGYLILLLSFLSFLALKEFLSITPTRQADRRVLFFAYLSIILQFVLIWNGWFLAFVAFLPVYIFLFLALLMVVIGESEGFLKAYSSLQWGLLLTVYSPGHLAYLLLLPPERNPSAGGAGLFLFLVMITQLSDVTQFLFGKLFDWPALSLKVSTTRNWASLIGSSLLMALLSWLAAPLLTPLTPAQAVISGTLIAGAGFIGYTTMSAIKNDLHLADRGTMTPGHGGVLNRLDSLFFTAPLFFYLVFYWHY